MDLEAHYNKLSADGVRGNWACNQVVLERRGAACPFQVSLETAEGKSAESAGKSDISSQVGYDELGWHPGLFLPGCVFGLISS